MVDVKQNAEVGLFLDEGPPGIPVTWVPGAPLPADLQTGHRAIDFEHRMLLGCMTTLRQLCAAFPAQEDCSSCAQAKRNQCEDELVGVLGDLLAFILDHFRTEEAHMRDSLLMMLDRDVCEAHMEDHANISGKVQEIVSALQSVQTARLLRELDVLLQRWIANHVMLHDVILQRWLEARGGTLKLP